MTSTPAPTAARPMVLIGFGLLIDLVDPTRGGWDLLPDWVGWLLVLVGTWAFVRPLANGSWLVVAAVVSVITDAAMWLPQSIEWLDAQEDAVTWATTLPGLAWAILYSLALSGLSRTDPGASFWWKYIAGMNVAAAILPIFVYGGGIASLTTFYLVLAWLGQVCAIVFSFVHSRRDWAVAGAPA